MSGDGPWEPFNGGVGDGSGGGDEGTTVVVAIGTEGGQGGGTGAAGASGMAGDALAPSGVVVGLPGASSPDVPPVGIAPVSEGGVPVVDLDVCPRNIEERHQLLNYMFGFAPTAKRVTRHEQDEEDEPSEGFGISTSLSSLFGPLVSLGNLFWTCMFGWWISLLYLLLALLLTCTYVGRFHGALLYHLASWYFWPFGRALERHHDQPLAGIPLAASGNNYGSVGGDGEATRARSASQGSVGSSVTGYRPPTRASGMLFSSVMAPRQMQNRAVGTQSVAGQWVARVLFWVLAAPILSIVHLVVAIISWFLVVFIPMFEVNMTGMQLLWQEPLAIFVSETTPQPGGEIVICTYRAAHKRYIHYERFGVNIMLLNLVPFVFVTLILGYVGKYVFFLRPIARPGIIFVCCLLSTVPLAYFIGQAVSSISAQSSFAVGAVLNATFGSIIEMILYGKLLLAGYANIVKASVTGSLLGVMLLLPGLAMTAGGIKFKIQRFSTQAAGVSSVLLLIATIGAFAPTVFYSIYGTYTLDCGSCVQTPKGALTCDGCTYAEGVHTLAADPIFEDRARPLTYVCAAILPLAYCVGLLYTLKTHTHIYDTADDDDEAGGHDAPEWSNPVCVIVLVSCTVLFALVSEALVDSIQSILASLGISELFLGLTLLAVTPNISEISNAVQFALQRNVMLSMEIGASAAAQITLIQMPVLTFFSAIVGKNDKDTFTLIWGRLDMFAVVFSVLIMSFSSLEGKTSYFTGCAHILVYAALIATFFYVPDVAGVQSE